MKDTFSITRFRLLVRRQWSENKKIYLLLWGVISLCLVVLTIFSDKSEMFDLYLLLFWFGGVVMTSTLFSRWPDFGRSSLFLLLPASSAEKLLCGLFFGLILFIPVYTLNFIFIRYIVTYLFVLLFPNNLIPYSTFIGNGIRELAYYSIIFYIFSFLSFLFVQSLYMICLIRFRKRQALIFLVTLLASVLLYNFLTNVLIGKMIHTQGRIVIDSFILPGSFPSFGYAGTFANQPVIEHFSFVRVIRNLNNMVWFIILALLYFASWYKLKEREL